MPLYRPTIRCGDRLLGSPYTSEFSTAAPPALTVVTLRLMGAVRLAKETLLSGAETKDAMVIPGVASAHLQPLAVAPAHHASLGPSSGYWWPRRPVPAFLGEAGSSRLGLSPQQSQRLWRSVFCPRPIRTAVPSSGPAHYQLATPALACAIRESRRCRALLKDPAPG